ncbi:hypothetical protein [Spongiactinospora sp. 9N601]|uniref:hypothetical protein n=1 Tax=Spongiactinospora sp. 9N601 TaxID=3375149 RepID=UPI0037AD22D1
MIAWSGEAVEHRLLFAERHLSRDIRLAYPDPRPDDWACGILRARSRQDRRGQPLWRMLNVRRQWLAMLGGLCQVCGMTGRDPLTGRVWWVITETAFRAMSRDSGLTNAPPTCLACIPESLAHCPRLRKSSAVYTVTRAEPVGVLADTFTPGPEGTAIHTGHNVYVGFDEFAMHTSCLALQLVVRLEGMRREPIS